MGSFSIWHWLIVLAIILILFGGGGKIPRLMGDLARGVKSFKSGLKEEERAEQDEPAEEPVRRVEQTEAKPAAASASRAKSAPRSRKTVKSKS
jgi:sec-independent protein translocase protein TatA